MYSACVCFPAGAEPVVVEPLAVAAPDVEPASLDVDAIYVEEATPAPALDDADALAVLLDVQAALSSLQGQVAEQHHDLTEQLRAIAGSEPHAWPLGGADVFPQSSGRLTDSPRVSERPAPQKRSRALVSQLRPRGVEVHADVVRDSARRTSAPESEHPAPQQKLSSKLSDGAGDEAPPLEEAPPSEPRSFTTITNRMVSNFLVMRGSLQSVETEQNARHVQRSSMVKWRSVARDLSQGDLQPAVRRVITWDGFDRMVGVVIFVNAVCIGVEIDLHTRGHFEGAVWDVLQTSEVVFLVLYSFELIMRLYASGRRALKSSWVVFDFVVVVLGWATQVANSLLRNDDLDMLQQLTLLRVLRLLRLVRAVRLIKQFKTLWRLVNGLLTSYDAIISTMVLIVLVIYLASCIGVELIQANDTLKASDDTEVKYLLKNNFNTLQDTMLTLVRFVSADSVSGLYEPIIREQPQFFLYFMALLLVISISLLNLITAVLVEGALDKAKEDRETMSHNLRRKAKRYVPLARELFQCMDSSCDGILTLAEVRNCLADGDDRAKALCHQLNKIAPFDSVMELFESLDVNGDGEITENEFVEGVLKTTLGDESSIEITQVLRLIRVIARKMQALETLAVAQGRGSNSG